MSGGCDANCACQQNDLRLERSIHREQRDDVRARLAREELVARLSRFLRELLPNHARACAILFALERARELLLVIDVRAVERDRFTKRGERVVHHVVLGIHVAERGQRARARRDGRQNAFPRRDRERRVALLKIMIAEIDEVRRIRAPDLREPREHAHRFVGLADASVKISESAE